MSFIKLIISIFLLIFDVKFLVSAYTSNQIDQKFRESNLVPDFIKTSPCSLLYMTWPSGTTANLGNIVESKETIGSPSCTWNKETGKYYTLIFFDADLIKGFIHWLVVNINDDDADARQVIHEYLSTTPVIPPLTHRYAGLIYKQQGKTDFSNLDTETRLRKLALEEFTTQFHLSGPIAGNFINGVVTKTPYLK